ncbi:MAG: SDR family oxidoreductase, partial [Psychrosphaera sp.]|nr:SDR family oxidoreductase [Psychrosphaera sp.]
MGLTYGPSFKSIVQIRHNDSEALSHLNLQGDSEGYALHPGLLDSAFQSVIALLSADVLAQGKAYVPFAASSINQHLPMSDECYVYITRSAVHASKANKPGSDIQQFNLIIVDNKGVVLVEIKELMFRAIKLLHKPEKNRGQPDKKVESTDTQMNGFAPVWQASSLTTPANRELGSVLIIDSDATIKNYFDGVSSSTTLVAPVEGRQSWADLIEGVSQLSELPQTIVFTANVEQCDLQAMTELSQALLAIKDLPKICIHYVYDAQVSPANGAMAEYFKALMLESSKFSAKVIQGADLAHLLDECRDQTNVALEIRYSENGQREVMRYQSFPMDNLSKNSGLLKTGGVYLITGGAGGIGLTFARHLVEQYQAKVILVGRSILSDDKQATIDAIKQGTGEAVYLTGDAGVLADVQSVVSQIKNTFGKLNGILHSAGVARTALITNKLEADTTATLAPKVSGTLNLDLATQNEALDLFVTFSSISAVIGEAGLSDYAYANGFMDRFAVQREQLVAKGERHGKTLSINWPVWSEGGMALNEQTKLLMKNVQGIEPIENGLALQVFEQSLSLPVSQFVVLPGNSEKINRVMGALGNTGISDKVSTVKVDSQQLSQFIGAKMAVM